MSEIDPQEFGRLEAEVSQLKEIMSEMRTDMKTMKADWDRAKGGTRVLFAVAAVLGGALASLSHWALAKL